MRMCAVDQNVSMPTRLLWRQPSRNSANSVKPASAIITPSSEILLCGRGSPLTRTLGSQLTRLYVLPVSPVVLIAWPTPVVLSSGSAEFPLATVNGLDMHRQEADLASRRVF